MKAPPVPSVKSNQYLKSPSKTIDDKVKYDQNQYDMAA